MPVDPPVITATLPSSFPTITPLEVGYSVPQPARRDLQASRCSRLRDCSPSAGGEIMAIVQIGKQAGLRGFPAEGLTRDEVGRRVALRDHVREEPEVSRHHQYVRGNAHGRQAQTAANGLGDLAERDGPVPDRVPIL